MFSDHVLIFPKQMWRRNSDSVLAVGLCFRLEKFVDFAVALQKVYSLLCRTVYLSVVLRDFLQKTDSYDESEVIVKLGETQVRPVHDLSFQRSVPGDVDDLGDYEKLVSSFCGWIVTPWIHVLYSSCRIVFCNRRKHGLS